VIAHLKILDLWPSAKAAPRFEPPPVKVHIGQGRGQIVATYDYADEHGELLYQAVRYDPKDFRQRRPVGSGWNWSIKGVRRVIYRMAEVMQAVADGQTIYICEGEKDVENARALGLVATCNAMGADNGTGNKWLPEFGDVFAGADVVVTGRVADPALFLAPLMHHFGWADDGWPRLGQGVLVGHLLECAAQVSGGYIADPGFVDVPGLDAVGFPLAEVQADGQFVLAKLPGTGGRIDRLTCTAQLLYEVEDPAAYLQPDVVAHFSNVRFTQSGPDQVAVQGASGAPRPEQLKATLGYREGYIGEGQISYAGPGARARGALALQLLASRLRRLGLDALEHRAELIGVDAMHGAQMGQANPLHEPYEVRLRLAVRCTTRAQAERVGQEVEALYLNGPAAGGGVTQSVREVIAAASVLVPRHVVQPRLDVLEL
jgi:hypothetical protein